MYMYCDSALIYEKTNSVEAFGNVRMEQGDTLFIYGDYLPSEYRRNNLRKSNAANEKAAD